MATNVELLFHEDKGFVNRFTLDDFERMTPNEREIYLLMIRRKLIEAQNNQNK